MINNQLSFYIYTPPGSLRQAWDPRLVDPGTVFLFKAASTMIVAAVQCTFVGKAESLHFGQALDLSQRISAVFLIENQGQVEPFLMVCSQELIAFPRLSVCEAALRQKFSWEQWKAMMLQAGCI